MRIAFHLHQGFRISDPVKYEGNVISAVALPIKYYDKCCRLIRNYTNYYASKTVHVYETNPFYNLFFRSEGKRMVYFYLLSSSVYNKGTILLKGQTRKSYIKAFTETLYEMGLLEDTPCYATGKSVRYMKKVQKLQSLYGKRKTK